MLKWSLVKPDGLLLLPLLLFSANGCLHVLFSSSLPLGRKLSLRQQYPHDHMSARQSMHGPSSWHAMGRRGRSIPTGRWLRWRLSLRPCVRTRWLLRLGPGLARVFELEATPQLAIAVSVLPALRSSYVQTEPTPVLTCGFLPVLPSCPKSEYIPCARARAGACVRTWGCIHPKPSRQ